MIRTLLLATLILLGAAGSGSGQVIPVTPPPADPRDELRYDGKSFIYWKDFLSTELKAEKRVDAVRAMAAFGSRGYANEATVAIVELLKDYNKDEAAFKIDSSNPEKGTPDQRIILEVHSALCKIGPETTPVLLAHLDHKAVRFFAVLLFADAFGKNLPVAFTESSVPVLVRWMQSKDGETRDLATYILGNAIVQELSEKKEKGFQGRFLQIVAKEKKEKAIVDALTQALIQGDNSTGEAAALLLGTMGPRAKSAVPALVRAELGGYQRGMAATSALAKIKPTPAERIPGLLAELKDGESRLWENAATKLGEMGADARIAVADLLIEIKKPLRQSSYYHPQNEINKERMALVAAFVKIAGTKEALPVIVELLDKSQVPGIERELVNLYLELEKDPKRVVTTLSKALQRDLVETNMIKTLPPNLSPGSPPATFREELIVALGAQGESAVPVLLQAFDRSDVSAKSAIIVTLGKIGPAAKESLPFLRKLLQSEYAIYRQYAEQAIAAITKK